MKSRMTTCQASLCSPTQLNHYLGIQDCQCCKYPMTKHPSTPSPTEQPAPQDRMLREEQGCLSRQVHLVIKTLHTLLAGHTLWAPAMQVPNTKQSQALGSAPRPAQSNLVQTGREPSTLRAPQGSPQKTTSMSKQLKVSSIAPFENCLVESFCQLYVAGGR